MGSNTLTFTGTKQFRINGFAGSQSFSMGGSGVFGIDAPAIVNGRFVVLDNGNVGIGNTAPIERLTVAGAVSVTGALSGLTNAGAGVIDYLILLLESIRGVVH